MNLFVELRALDEVKALIVIPDEENIADYYELRQQLDILNKDLRDVLNHPTYALPFLQPGRLVRVKHDDMDFGWGCVVNYQKRVGIKVRILSLFLSRFLARFFYFLFFRESLCLQTSHHRNSTSSTFCFTARQEPHLHFRRKGRRQLRLECDHVHLVTMASLLLFLFYWQLLTGSATSESSSPKILNRWKQDSKPSRVCKKSEDASLMGLLCWIQLRIWESLMMRSKSFFGSVLLLMLLSFHKLTFVPYLRKSRFWNPASSRMLCIRIRNLLLFTSNTRQSKRSRPRFEPPRKRFRLLTA